MISRIFEIFLELESKRLVFRAFQETDIDFIFELHRNEEIMKY